MASLGKRGKPLLGQSREIIYNVYKYFVTEAGRFKKNEDENVSCYFKKVQVRVANATGISRRTLNNILNEVSTETNSTEIKFSTPKKGRPKKQFRLDMNDFDYDVIRRMVYDFHVRFHEVPTIKSLKAKLSEAINYNGSERTLRTILHEMGFRFTKIEDNRKVIIEKHDFQGSDQKKGYCSEASSLLDGDEVSIGEDSCEICLHEDIKNEAKFRFVCVQCADMYLCKACFDEGLHSHHYMLRIPKNKPNDEVSRVVSRLRTELTTETASQEQAVPQVEQDVPELEHDKLKQEPDVPLLEQYKLEQEQAVPEEEYVTNPSNFGPNDEEESNVKAELELELDTEILSDQEDCDYEITIKEESLEDEIDRRRVEPCVEQVVGRTHTTTATHSHTKRAPSGDSEAGPSKVARSTGTGPHYTRSTETSGRNSHVRIISNKTRSNVQVLHVVYNEED